VPARGAAEGAATAAERNLRDSHEEKTKTNRVGWWLDEVCEPRIRKRRGDGEGFFLFRTHDREKKKEIRARAFSLQASRFCVGT
jgi:hypothetical protein